MEKNTLLENPEDEMRDDDEFENRLIDVDCMFEDEIESLVPNENFKFKQMEW